MNKNLRTVKGNVRGIYKDQAKKIKANWEWQCVWSYMDRLIKMQVIEKNQLEAIKCNNKLFIKYSGSVV